jgi:hypothetical protein
MQRAGRITKQDIPFQALPFHTGKNCGRFAHDMARKNTALQNLV